MHNYQSQVRKRLATYGALTCFSRAREMTKSRGLACSVYVVCVLLCECSQALRERMWAPLTSTGQSLGQSFTQTLAHAAEAGGLLRPGEWIPLFSASTGRCEKSQPHGAELNQYRILAASR